MYFNMSTKKKKKKKYSRRSALVPVILILIVVMVALVAVWQLRGVIGSNATTARASSTLARCWISVGVRLVFSFDSAR